MSEFVGAVIDIETTGLEPGVHEIIELCIITHDEDFNPKEKLLTNIKPMRPELFTKSAMEINGYKKEDFARFPTPVQVRNVFFSWVDEVLSGKKIQPLGHNYDFDKNFLQLFLGKERYYSIFHYSSRDSKVATQFLRDCVLLKQVENTKLVTMCEYFKIPHYNKHTAEGDCLATLSLYKELLKLNKRSF